MFKVVVLPTLGPLSDDATEFQIIDLQQTINPFPAGTAARRPQRGLALVHALF